LLTGASSSGKSTILNIIAQHDGSSTVLSPPTHSGTVTITASSTLRNQSTTTGIRGRHHHATDDYNNDKHIAVAKPILFDTISMAQYRLQYESRRSISKILQDDIASMIMMLQTSKYKPQHQSSASSSNIRSVFNTTIVTQHLNMIVNDLIDRVGLFPHNYNLNQHDPVTPSQLSTSEQYKLAILRACFYSSCSSYNQYRFDLYETNEHHNAALVLPGPILLFDECFDQETSLTIQTIQSILSQLCTHIGAVIIVTTHVPQRWKQTSTLLPPPQVMKLCRGGILLPTPDDRSIV
jgi:ABC-type thiamine transport system ATPase subunit